MPLAIKNFVPGSSVPGKKKRVPFLPEIMSPNTVLYPNISPKKGTMTQNENS